LQAERSDDDPVRPFCTDARDLHIISTEHPMMPAKGRMTAA
jgi:hypothetical protein